MMSVTCAVNTSIDQDGKQRRGDAGDQLELAGPFFVGLRVYFVGTDQRRLSEPDKLGPMQKLTAQKCIFWLISQLKPDLPIFT